MPKKNNWNFKDPNRKSNRMQLTPSNEWLAKRWEIFNEVKAKGGSDIAGIVKALEIVPVIKTGSSNNKPKVNRRRK